MYRILLIIVCFFVETSVFADNDKAQKYLREAEYYTKKAEEHEHDAAYYNKKAEDYLRQANYYSRKNDSSIARTYSKWANDASEKASSKSLYFITFAIRLHNSDVLPTFAA